MLLKALFRTHVMSVGRYYSQHSLEVGDVGECFVLEASLHSRVIQLAENGTVTKPMFFIGALVASYLRISLLYTFHRVGGKSHVSYKCDVNVQFFMVMLTESVRKVAFLHTCAVDGVCYVDL